MKHATQPRSANPCQRHCDQSANGLGRARLALAVILFCCGLNGCISPMNTRYPVLGAFHPMSESQSYQQQDPFLDPDIGPGDETRPRDFSRPRTESRRAAEQRLLQGLPSAPENVPPGYPRGGLNTSRSVY